MTNTMTVVYCNADDATVCDVLDCSLTVVVVNKVHTSIDNYSSIILKINIITQYRKRILAITTPSSTISSDLPQQDVCSDHNMKHR